MDNMVNRSKSIKKAIKDIIRLAILLIVLVTINWFYEPIMKNPMSETAENFFLTIFLLLPALIIANGKKLLRALNDDGE